MNEKPLEAYTPIGRFNRANEATMTRLVCSSRRLRARPPVLRYSTARGITVYALYHLIYSTGFAKSL
jgi:hypothetical protein